MEAMRPRLDKDEDLKDCQVVINERQVFFPGEKITGAVKVHTSRLIYASSISVKICGQAYVRWSESHQFDTNEYINCENYINESRTLLECNENNVQGERLPPGDNDFPFSFLIPASHVPSSFNHGWYKKDYAVIRYWVRACISFDDGEEITVAREFYVKETMDLTTAVHLKEPQKMSADEYVCWWCFKTGPVILHLETNCAGYYPGEDIVITVGVDTTLSSVSTGKVEAELVQRVNYVANSDYSDKSYSKSGGENSLEREHWNTEKNLLLSASVGSRRQMNWGNVRLKIPKAIVPSISCSKCVQLSYFVQLKVYLRLSEDCIIRMPIIIVSKPRVNSSKNSQNVTDDKLTPIQDTDSEWQAG